MKSIQRSVYRLHLTGLSTKEISNQLGITENATRVHLCKERKRLGIKVSVKTKPPETNLIPYAGQDPYSQEYVYPTDPQSKEILHETMKMMDRCNPVHPEPTPVYKPNRFLDTPEGVEALKRLRERELYLAEAQHPHLPEAYLLRVPKLSALEDKR